MADTHYTHVIVIADSSGSMSRMAREMNDGFRKFMRDQAALLGKCMVHIVRFAGSQIATVVDNRPVRDAVSNGDLIVPNGGTPLYDAMCLTIDRVGAVFAALPADQQPNKVLCLVLTDGEENASRMFPSVTHVRDRVKHQQAHYGWEFIYLGANVDAKYEASNLGMPAAAGYDYTPNNAAQVFAAASGATMRSRSGEAYKLSAEEQSALVNLHAPVQPTPVACVGDHGRCGATAPHYAHSLACLAEHDRITSVHAKRA